MQSDHGVEACNTKLTDFNPIPNSISSCLVKQHIFWKSTLAI